MWIAVMLILLLKAASAFSAGFTFAWDPNSETNIAGYKLHYSTNSGGPYTSVVDAGLVTTFSITNLPYGRTFFFTLTAYDTAGSTSAFSAEISGTTPAAPPPAPPVNFRITNILQGASSASGPWTNVAETVYSVPAGFYRERMRTASGTRNTTELYVAK